MPAAGKKEMFILSLFFKCEKYKTLPYPGGVLSQPAWILRIFDCIEQVREQIEIDKAATQDALAGLK